jgi:mycothiol system anti-sigma-R factor
MMNCAEAQRFIHAYLDGEFDEREWSAIRAHLDVCPGCKRRAEFEERFRQVLKSSLPQDKAPELLRARVTRRLAAADGQASRRWALRLVPAAAAAMILGGLALNQLRKRDDLAIVDQSIDWHRKHLPLDVTGSSPEAIQRYFSDKVPFAVRPPAFLGEKAQLVGARLANLREHQAVYLTYKVNGRRVSVFIFDPDAVPAEGPQLQAGSRRVRVNAHRGYNTLTYTSGGTGYAVTSDMDPRGLVQLVSHEP